MCYILSKELEKSDIFAQREKGNLIFQLSPLNPCLLEMKKPPKHFEQPKLQKGRLFALQVKLVKDPRKKSGLLTSDQNIGSLTQFEKIPLDTKEFLVANYKCQSNHLNTQTKYCTVANCGKNY